MMPAKKALFSETMLVVIDAKIFLIFTPTLNENFKSLFYLSWENENLEIYVPF